MDRGKEAWMAGTGIIEDAAKQLVDAAVAVHRELGPGLLEHAYVQCLAFELRARGQRVETQKPLTLRYRGKDMGLAYRLDMVVGGLVVVELKAVGDLLPIHEAQLLSYLRLGNYKLGFLLNFKVRRMRDGIRRMVNGL
jgi:GxxExxY protein